MGSKINGVSLVENKMSSPALENQLAFILCIFVIVLYIDNITVLLLASCCFYFLNGFISGYLQFY